ncbi:MAG: virulence RhuM family protein, partial [Victivallales bacterium]|nr:virulence RhuM family protein [Victivallales bacterium]
NLDAIISVGYRVNSILGVRFRQWATSILKNYLLRGYAVNDRLDRLETQRLRQTCGIAVETFRLVNYIIPITNFIPI